MFLLNREDIKSQIWDIILSPSNGVGPFQSPLALARETSAERHVFRGLPAPTAHPTLRGSLLDYRAYGAPHASFRQRQALTETPIPPLERSRFRVQGAAPPGHELNLRAGVGADHLRGAFR